MLNYLEMFTVGLIFFVIVFWFGIFFFSLYERFIRKPVGRIRIDSSDPDGPYLFLELYGGLEDLKKKKFATVQIVNKNYERVYADNQKYDVETWQ